MDGFFPRLLTCDRNFRLVETVLFGNYKNHNRDGTHCDSSIPSPETNQETTPLVAVMFNSVSNSSNCFSACDGADQDNN
jgi:hypothetical protein